MDAPSDAQPPLRLRRPPRQSLTLRFGQPVEPAEATTNDLSRPLKPLSSTDPRWVLAVRTSQVIQGDVVTAADREQLLRAGSVMGLNAFESNLVIAIVQDQARRGQGIDTATPALQFVPIHSRSTSFRRQWLWRVALWSLALLGLELALVAAIV